jgi:hypothetical protein
LLLILHRERDPDAREQWEGLRDTYARPTFSFGPDGQPRRGPDGGFIFNEKPPGFVNPIRDLRGTLSAASQAGVIVGDAGALVRDYLATSVLACTLPEAVRRALASLEHAAAPDFLPTLLDLTTDGKAWLLAGKELRFPKTETAGVRGSRRVTRRSDAGLFLESLLRPGGVPWAGGGAPEGRSHLCAALAAAGGQMRLEGTGATVQLVPRPVLAERARVALKGASRG